MHTCPESAYLLSCTTSILHRRLVFLLQEAPRIPVACREQIENSCIPHPPSPHTVIDIRSLLSIPSCSSLGVLSLLLFAAQNQNPHSRSIREPKKRPCSE